MENFNKNKSIFIDFFSGLLGGITSVTICAPLDITRTRLNMMVNNKFAILKYYIYIQNSENSKIKYEGFIDALKTIKKQEGMKGFFKGYFVKN